MGMDVYGRDMAESYFRANVWSWRPILDLMRELCSDFLSKELLHNMAMNNGVGPVDQETCDKIADRLEEWLKEHHDGHSVVLNNLAIDESGRFVNPRDPGDKPVGKLRSPYFVSDDHLKEFVEFLRICQGFEVW